MLLMIPLLFPSPFVILLEILAGVPVISLFTGLLRSTLLPCYLFEMVPLILFNWNSSTDAYYQLEFAVHEFHCGYPGPRSGHCLSSPSLVFMRAIAGLQMTIATTMFYSMGMMFYNQPWNKHSEVEDKKNN